LRNPHCFLPGMGLVFALLSPAAAQDNSAAGAAASDARENAPAPVAESRPLAGNSKWAEFGPLAYYMDRELVLFDEQAEDLILPGETDGGFFIVSPDRNITDPKLRAVATKSWSGRLTFVRFFHGTPGFKQRGRILPDGSVRFSWSSLIIGAKFEDTFTPLEGGCLRWTEYSKSSDSETNDVRTYCPIADDAAQRVAAQRHVDRNIRLGLDSDSFWRSVKEAEAKAAEDRAARNRDKLERDLATIRRQNAMAGVLDDANAVMAGRVAESSAALDTTLEHMRQQQREQERQQREREAQQQQQQIAQQQAAESATQAREQQLRQQQAEQQRMAAANAEADRQRQAELQGQREAEQRRVTAEQDRQRQQQDLRQAEQNLRSSFSGHATTCAGGGRDVLYLQTSRPPKTGCNVSFEARCPGTASGAGTRFSQSNYIGGSCMGVGDNIRIGAMDCPAGQVQITMTGAQCG